MGFVDDRSPARHLLGYIGFGYTYEKSQVEAGLRAVESNDVANGGSQQDYDLGAVGYKLGDKLRTRGYSVPDLIDDLTTSLADTNNVQENNPGGVAYDGPQTSAWCYLGVTC